MTKVLIIKMSSMGDIIHAFPALRDLKERHPSFECHWVVEEGFLDIANINNDIDHVYSNVIADSGGTLQAASTTSELEVLGGTAISTVGAAGPSNAITINNDGVTSAVDGEGITLSGATGAVTITADVAKYVLPSVAAPGAGGTIAINHALGEEDVMVTVRETGEAGAGFYAGVDYTLTFTDGNNLVIPDIGGALGAGTLSVSVMG